MIKRLLKSETLFFVTLTLAGVFFTYFWLTAYGNEPQVLTIL